MALSPTLSNRITWVVRVVLALAFAAAGVSKLIGAEAMVVLFDQIGFGQGFRFVTGGIEVAGALLVIVPGTGLLGALVLGGTMVGAVATHLTIGGSAVPAVVLGLLCSFVVYRLWPEQGRGLLARVGLG